MSTCASIIADRNQTTEEGNSNNKASTIVANHSQGRRRFKVPGSTHWPSARQRDGGPYRLQKANPSDSRAAALSQGRHGSRAVRLPIQAPLIPSRTSASGTTQQTRSEEHTSELQSLMRISYAVFCLKKKQTHEQSQLSDLQQSNHQD